ncbi:hypothetical protein MRX96_037669 [Rhipicephalus microplus]
MLGDSLQQPSQVRVKAAREERSENASGAFARPTASADWQRGVARRASQLGARSKAAAATNDNAATRRRALLARKNAPLPLFDARRLSLPDSFSTCKDAGCSSRSLRRNDVATATLTTQMSSPGGACPEKARSTKAALAPPRPTP